MMELCNIWVVTNVFDILQALGPSWEVLLGRRDSLTANRTLANLNLPGPDFTLDQLISSFANQNLSVTDLVALSGMNIYNISVKISKVL